jgi:hypothetical protein
MPAIPQAKLQKFLTCIQKITLIIKEAREGAVDRQDWEFGDDAQVLGIRAYKHLVKVLMQVKGTLGYEWLRCYAPKGRLTIQICLGDSPKDRILLRVWRADDPDLQPEQKRMMLPVEAQYSFELFPTEKGVIDRWGLVYQIDHDKRLDTAYLVGYDSQNQRIIESHEILPFDNVFASLTEINKLPEAVKIAAPKVRLKQNTISKRGSNDEPEQ